MANTLKTRLAALEDTQATHAPRGFRHFTTNDALQARGLYLDCNNAEGRRDYRYALPAAGGEDVDELDEEARARLVGQDVLDQAERDGWQVLIVRYTSTWGMGAMNANP